MVLKIAVAGEIRSGKDTVCKYIMDNTCNVEKLYFAEGIEKIIREFFPEAFADNDKPRKHYQDIGQFMRTLNPNVWINYTANVYNNSYCENFIVTDLRQHNEYEWLKSEGFTLSLIHI